jgi:hypothetical protein
MKKNYEAPQVSQFGSVENLTSFFGDSGSDKIVGPGVPGGSVTGVGTANFCQTPNDVNCQ